MALQSEVEEARAEVDELRALLRTVPGGEEALALTSVEMVFEQEMTSTSPPPPPWSNGPDVLKYAKGLRTRRTDHDFPHNKAAEDILDGAGQDGWACEFIPARGVPAMCGYDASATAVFDGGIQIGDIRQGGMGDCWLIAAMAAAAEFPELIENCFKNHSLEVPHCSDDGNYLIRLFDPLDECAEVEMEMNDLVPVVATKKDGRELQNWQPVFCRPTGNEIWTMLLEKAVAKLFKTSRKIQEMHGHEGNGYGMLNGGCSLFAWAMLTGATKHGSITKDENNVWHELRVTKLTSKCAFSGRVGKSMNAERFFQYLQQLDEADCLIGASMPGSPPAHAGGEPVKDNGLVQGHAYSVIQVRQCSTGHRMVQLRNPWGTDAEWKGRWSDVSDDWKSKDGQKIATELEHDAAPDGLFWMEWKDFVAQWDTVCFTRVTLENQKRKNSATRKSTETAPDPETSRPEARSASPPKSASPKRAAEQPASEGRREVTATELNREVRAMLADVPCPTLRVLAERGLRQKHTVTICRVGGVSPEPGSVKVTIVTKHGFKTTQFASWGPEGGPGGQASCPAQTNSPVRPKSQLGLAKTGDRQESPTLAGRMRSPVKPKSARPI